MLKSKLFALILTLLTINAFASKNPNKKDEGTTGIQFFHGTFKEALAKAKKEKKLVLMDCYTTWCGPCKYLKTKVFTDKALGDYINQKFISIAVDYENGEGPGVAQMYPVEGYPTLYFLDGAGKVKKTILGVPQGGAKEILQTAQKLK
ncbi:thioredoxin family protein [Flectobacillus major]|jgi:thiol:disulfide interchange protein|uniref:thioredoxin family protein n=1 Tax=Flectobacillus major TaxID=103 RepID=UPI00047D3CB7|nr:thioredoxin family protein [Flectobacillus major]